MIEFANVTKKFGDFTAVDECATAFVLLALHNRVNLNILKNNVGYH